MIENQDNLCQEISIACYRGIFQFKIIKVGAEIKMLFPMDYSTKKNLATLFLCSSGRTEQRSNGPCVPVLSKCLWSLNLLISLRLYL